MMNGALSRVNGKPLSGPSGTSLSRCFAGLASSATVFHV